MEIWSIVVGPLKTNTYIVVDHRSRSIVVDPGPTSFQKIVYMLDRNYIAGVEYIVLTHGHFDHVGDAQSLKEVTNAKIVMHRDDFPLIEYSIAVARRYGVELRYPEVDEFVSNDTVLSFGGIELEILWLPGHTRGSIALLLRREKALFVGDTLLPSSVLYIDPVNGSIDDYLVSLEKLRRLDRGYTVYPGHGKPMNLVEALDLAEEKIKYLV